MSQPAGPTPTQPATGPSGIGAWSNPWGAVPVSPEPPPRPFGPVQGLLLVAGFPLVQTAVALVAGLVRGFVLGFARPGVARSPAGPGFLAITIVAAYGLGALWVWHRAMRRGGERLRRGGPEGFAWRPAPRSAYALAVGLAAVTVAVAAFLLHVIPVSRTTPPDAQFKALLTPGWTLLPALGMIFLLAPFTEEFLFRGAAFAAFAARAGTFWAGVIVTALFVAVHAPEKLGYPPGFLDVGLMALGALWLRLRYRSIRPGILLHVLYNLGVVVVAALLH